MKKNQENGFTLIELMVVTAVTGLLVVAATSIMVSFSKFKYMADVQEQLKTEAAFATNQIDLLIRNSNGIPDLCLASFKDESNPTEPYRFCDGNPQYVSDPLNQVADDDLGNTSLGTDATIVKCTDPQSSHITTGRDDLNTVPGTANNNILCNNPSFLCTNSEGPYRDTVNNDTCSNSGCLVGTGGSSGSISKDGYLVVQIKKSIPAAQYRPPSGSYANKHYLGRVLPNPNSPEFNPPVTSKIYNQIIYRQPVYSSSLGLNDNKTADESQGQYIDQASGQNSQYKIAIFEYEVNKNSNPTQMLCCDVPNAVNTGGVETPVNTQFPDGSRDIDPNSFKNLFLTSNAVDVTDLTFSCKLANYGLPSQSAVITYNLSLRKRNKSLTDKLYGDNFNEDSFTQFSLTRTVNVRNSSHPFIFSQTGQ